MEQFIKLGLSDSSIQALEKKGFEEPTEIQEKTIPVLLDSDCDIIAQAQTGTGKTAAFGLVFVEKLEPYQKRPQALVLTPTRELAVQVAEEINSFKGDKKLQIVPIYGGQSISLQLRQLKKGVDIVIGTPGRIMDHLKRGSLDLSGLKYTVLDEADEMLNMGFIDDIEEILSHTNEERQLLLFSATMPDRIKSLAKKFMPEFVSIKSEKGQLTTKLVNQIYFEVRESDKFEALCRIIDIEAEFYGIIFCRTKINVDIVTKKLTDRSYLAEALHGDIVQSQRERILENFKKQKTLILVATDVAARGIDVNNLTHVINYSLPQDPESYVHRIGRTGRAGNEGTAITFVTPEEFKRLSFIKRVAKTDIRREKLPQVDEIISIKKKRIRKDLETIIETEDLEYYKDLVPSIIGSADKETAIAALLKQAFADELEKKNYSDIKELNFKQSFSRQGKTRLFVTIGKKDKMTPKKLVSFIEKVSGVSEYAIQNVEIYDIYSFVTVPFEQAEQILHKFKKRKKGSNIVIEKAQDKRGGRRGGDRRGGGGRKFHDRGRRRRSDW